MEHASPFFRSGLATEIAREIPARYGEDILVAMARDPGWVFAYWEVTEKTVKQAQERFGSRLNGSQIVLRVFDAVPPHLDVPVGTLIGSWYLELHTPNRQIHLELGFLTIDKDFISLIQSNRFRVPNGSSGSIGGHPEGELLNFHTESGAGSLESGSGYLIQVSEELQNTIEHRFNQEQISNSFSRFSS